MKKCQPQTLTPFLDGELAPESRKQTEEHLRSCAACVALLDEVTSARERVRGMGRSLVPGTTLMPALATLRERAGIEEAGRLHSGDIREPPVDAHMAATAPVLLETTILADEEALNEVMPLDDPDIYIEERFRAVLTVDPIVSGQAPHEAPTPAEEQVTPEQQEATREQTVAKEPPIVAEPGIDGHGHVTWVDIPPMDAPVEDLADAPPIASTSIDAPPHVPAPPPLKPTPWMGAAAAGQGPEAVTDVAPYPIPVFEPPLISQPPPVPERSTRAETRGKPEPFSAVVPPTEDAEPEILADLGPLPWEQEVPQQETHAALEERPNGPVPQPVPPWVEAEAADAQDIEARGRRLVEEDLAAQVAMEREAGADWLTAPPPIHDEPADHAELAPAELEPEAVTEAEVDSPDPAVHEAAARIREPAALKELATDREAASASTPFRERAIFPPDPSPELTDEVAAAVASMRGELTAPPVAAGAAFAAIDEPVAGTGMEGYRDALRHQRRDPRESTMPALNQQLMIGIGAAAAIVVLVLADVLMLPRLGTHGTSPAASTPAGHATPTGQATPGGATSPAASAGASPAASTAPGIPQLSGVVTRGGAGSGYKVRGIRTGNPAAGVYRIVFDLDGTGPVPDAQLGRAGDGSLYLQATGISIDPATIAGFQALGPIRGMSSAGAPGGLSLRLASSQAQSPQYSMYYLTGRDRLVIDLK